MRKSLFINRFHRPAFYRGLILLVVLFWIALVSACSYSNRVSKDAREITGEVKSVDADFKKNVWLVFPEDHSFLKPRELSIDFYQYLYEACGKSCSEIVLRRFKPEDSQALPEKPPGSVFDRVDNFELALAGRRMGVGAVVISDISDVRQFEEELGFWWFAEDVKILAVDVTLTIYDTETGAKLLEKVITYEAEIDDALSLQIEAQDETADVATIITALEALAEETGEEICDAMYDRPFKTFIRAIDGEKVTLTTGETGGLVEGAELGIYDSSRLMTGKYGHRYFVPGLRSGVLRVTAVFADSAEGVVISGEVSGKDACAKPFEE